MDSIVPADEITVLVRGCEALWSDPVLWLSSIPLLLATQLSALHLKVLRPPRYFILEKKKEVVGQKAPFSY